MSLTFKNTIEKGTFRYIIFKEAKIWYGVALEFNIVVSANDPAVAQLELFEVATGYVRAVKKSKVRPFALNQVPNKEYSDMWNKLTKSNGNIESPQEFYSFGTRILA